MLAIVNSAITGIGGTHATQSIITSASNSFQSGPVAQLGARFHGMEEVVGSIPTRSTKCFNSVTIPIRDSTFQKTFLNSFKAIPQNLQSSSTCKSVFQLQWLPLDGTCLLLDSVNS